MTVFSVPGGVGWAGQTGVVDQVQSGVAHAGTVDLYLVGAAGVAGDGGGGAGSTVENSSIGADLALVGDFVVAGEADARGTVEVGVVAAGGGGGLALFGVGVVEVPGETGVGGSGSAVLSVPGLSLGAGGAAVERLLVEPGLAGAADSVEVGVVGAGRDHYVGHHLAGVVDLAVTGLALAGH